MRFKQDDRGRWVRDVPPQPRAQPRGWHDESTLPLASRSWWRVHEVLGMLGRSQAPDHRTLRSMRFGFQLKPHDRDVDDQGLLVVRASNVRRDLAKGRQLDEWPEEPAIAAPPAAIFGVGLVDRLRWSEAEARHLLGVTSQQLRDLVASGQIDRPVDGGQGHAAFVAHLVVRRLQRQGTGLSLPATAPILQRLAPQAPGDAGADAASRAIGKALGIKAPGWWQHKAEQKARLATIAAASGWTEAELLARLGMSDAEVRRLVAAGKLPAAVVGVDGVQRFDEASVRAAVGILTSS